MSDSYDAMEPFGELREALGLNRAPKTVYLYHRCCTDRKFNVRQVGKGVVSYCYEESRESEIALLPGAAHGPVKYSAYPPVTREDTTSAPLSRPPRATTCGIDKCPLCGAVIHRNLNWNKDRPDSRTVLGKD